MPMTLIISPRTHVTGAPEPERECSQSPMPELIPLSKSVNFADQKDETRRSATANALGNAASLGVARPEWFSAASGPLTAPTWAMRPILPLPNKLLQIAARYAPHGFHRLCKAPGFHHALLREHPDREWIAAGLARAVDGLAAEPFNREARGMVQVFKKIDVALRLASGRDRILAAPDAHPDCDTERTRRAALRDHYMNFAGELDPILITHELAALDQISWLPVLDKNIAIIDLCRAGIGALTGEPLKRGQQTALALKVEDRTQLPEDVAQFSEILKRFGGIGVLDLAEIHPRRSD